MRPAHAPLVIDTQTHHLPRRAVVILERVARREPLHGLVWPVPDAAPMLRIESALAAMDEAGVDVSVLSAPPLGVVADCIAVENVSFSQYFIRKIEEFR